MSASPAYHSFELDPHGLKEFPSTYAQATSLLAATPLDAALAYAAQGIPVFPLQDVATGACSCRESKKCTRDGKAGKHPRTPHGHLDATTDPDKIREWWTRWPNANIGIPTGEVSGILVLDFDTYKYSEGLADLEAAYGPLPATRKVSSGSGGLHVYLRYPRGASSDVGRMIGWRYGVDVLGNDGYVIAPPSITSGPYTVLTDLPAAPVPARLLAALRSKRRAPAESSATATNHPARPSATGTATGAARGAAFGDAEPIPYGARNATLTSIAGRLHDGTRTLDRLTADLDAVNRSRCSPPIGDHPTDGAGEIAGIAKSIHRREPCRKQRKTITPEMVRAVERIANVHLWSCAWKGTGWKVPRSVFVSLLLLALDHGTLIPAGVRVSISQLALAELAAAGETSTKAAIKKLRECGYIRRDDLDRKPTEAGAFVLVLPPGDPEATPGGPPPRKGDPHTRGGGPRREERERDTHAGWCGSPLRAALVADRLRWTGCRWHRDGDEWIRETIHRLGKSCEQAIDVLVYHGGEMDLGDLAACVGVKRVRDYRKRNVARLEAAAVAVVDGDVVRLTPHWLDALQVERERAGEIDAADLQRARHQRQRDAYREHLADKKTEKLARALARACGGSVPEADPVATPKVIALPDIRQSYDGPEPDGEIRELQLVKDETPVDTEVLAAVRQALARWPDHRHDLPGWWASTVYVYDYLPYRPSNADVEDALIHLGLRSLRQRRKA